MANSEIISRIDAANSALSRYYTGVPCGKNHLAERYVASGNCVECAKNAGRSYSKNMRAARLGVGNVEYRCVVPIALAETFDAMVAAEKLAPRPCPNNCPAGAVCAACDPRGTL